MNAAAVVSPQAMTGNTGVHKSIMRSSCGVLHTVGIPVQ